MILDDTCNSQQSIATFLSPHPGKGDSHRFSMADPADCWLWVDVYIGFTPHSVAVTTRIITLLHVE